MDHCDYKNIFQECMDHLLQSEKKLHSETKDETEHHFLKNLEVVWGEIDLVSKKLSQECTKLCILFCNSPIPTSAETSALLQSIEGTVLALVHIIAKLNLSIGKTLYGELTSSSISAIQSTRQLLRVIKEENGGEVNERYRQATGIAWEGCTHLENCPKNNKIAVLNKLVHQKTLVDDAFQEINEEMKGDGGGWAQQCSIGSEIDEEDETWSEEDKEFMIPSVNLIKASKLLFKRIVEAIESNGRCEKPEEINDLDQILDNCQPVSQTIDSLVLDLYPPLDVARVKTLSQNLATQIFATLNTAVKSHVITEAEQPGVEFIKQAVNHNLDKIK